MRTDDIVFKDAGELADAIRARELSCVEIMEAHLSQIERFNPALNAIVTLDAEGALAAAKTADSALARGQAAGALFGLPVAIKDTTLTAGIRTTWGSPIFKDHVPTESALLVHRLQAAGAIVIGKTNVPEFAAGSQTYNPVFGATRNPYDLDKTCGGSSGGAAVALATGMCAIADGSDMGGSLRNPASFCNVVGLRPSPGRVPMLPMKAAWNTLAVAGPMGRSVSDVARMLSVIGGPDSRCPLSLDEPGSRFAQPLARDFRGTRIAFSADFGGSMPVDPAVVRALEAQLPVFAAMGCDVTGALPDFEGAHDIFLTLRGIAFESAFGPLLDQHRDLMKDDLVWNIEQGRALTGARIAEADRGRTALFARMHRFMQDTPFLVLPVSQVPPFPVTQPYVPEINGQRMANYLEWMQSCCCITVTGHPAISVPCGFTTDGLPVGLQIVGRHRDDWGVLQLAFAFEQTTRTALRRAPMLAAGAHGAATPAASAPR